MSELSHASEVSHGRLPAAQPSPDPGSRTGRATPPFRRPIDPRGVDTHTPVSPTGDIGELAGRDFNRLSDPEFIAAIACAAVGSFGTVRVPSGLPGRSGTAYTVTGDSVRVENVHDLGFSPTPYLRPELALQRIVVGARQVKQTLEGQIETARRLSQIWFVLVAASAVLGLGALTGGVVGALFGFTIAGGIFAFMGLLWGVVAKIFHGRDKALRRELTASRRHIALLDSLIASFDIVDTIEEPGKRNDAKAELLQQVFGVDDPADDRSWIEDPVECPEASPFRAGLTAPKAPLPAAE